MERKCMRKSGFLHIGIAAIFLFTLHSCEHNSGQARNKTPNSIEWTDKHKEVLGFLYKQWRRQRCLSAIILTASDTKECFACHDKIERR